MRVEIIVDGRPEPSINVMPGDQVLLSVPGLLLNGKHKIAEWRLEGARKRLNALDEERSRLLDVLEQVAIASSLGDAHSLARGVVGDPYDD